MIAKLRHRVVLCRQHDIVEVAGEMTLKREGITFGWAEIVAKKASAFSPHGAAIKDSRNTRSHIITMRYRTDLNISIMAWVYEERLKSSPRWFKVLSYTETESGGSPCWKLDCRLVERGDDLATPTEADAVQKGLPKGVVL
jgi:head-tail adaptor